MLKSLARNSRRLSETKKIAAKTKQKLEKGKTFLLSGLCARQNDKLSQNPFRILLSESLTGYGRTKPRAVHYATRGFSFVLAVLKTILSYRQKIYHTTNFLSTIYKFCRCAGVL